MEQRTKLDQDGIRSRFWRWSDGHEEYEVEHREEGWQVHFSEMSYIIGANPEH